MEFVFNYNKYKIILIPIKDVKNIKLVEQEFPQLETISHYSYFLDGKERYHNGTFIPSIPQGYVDIGILDERTLSNLGYTKHWEIFYDIKSDRYTFGNYTSFSTSKDPRDRERAKTFPVIDLEYLKSL